MEPTQHDIGPDADLLGTVDIGVPKLKTKGWKYAMHGYFRAPMRVGIGPRNDLTEGEQLHSPARVVGYNNSEWEYVGLTPNPGGSLYFNVSNPNVDGNVIITTNTLNDAGYDNLIKIGGVAQAYVTMKFPELFGSRGGGSATIGAFSNRYGVAGPRQESTGYYGTYLFGRTHVVGTAITADYDLTDHLELIVEDGFGEKLEVVPTVATPPVAPFLPSQGPVPQGSTFVHHAHVSLLVDDWLQVAGHFIQSFSPNDFFPMPGTRAPWASLTISGGEVHFDSPKFGNGYIGYSHINAQAILPLAGGVEVIHGVDGLGFKQNYFTKLPNPQLLGSSPANDSGTVDTILFQYIARLAPLMGRPRGGWDLALGLFGMYNHIKAPNNPTPLRQDRLKFGADLVASPARFMSVGMRFDRVLPDGPNTDFAYSAFSPRVVFHTAWLSREYVTLEYTRYFYGPKTIASAPYDTQTQRPDPNMVVVSAAISF